MTRSLDDYSGLSAPDIKVLEDIRKHSWHVIGVFPSQGEAGPGWAFSIGLFHSFAHPEVVVFGLDFNNCTKIVNEIGLQIRRGKRFHARQEYAEILNDPYRCSFRDVQRQHYRTYLGYALWFYQSDPFPVAQCFWPDKAGNLPWEAGCNSEVRDAQPLLFLP